MLLTHSLSAFDADLDGSVLRAAAAVDAFLASSPGRAWAAAAALGAAAAAAAAAAPRGEETAALPLRELRAAYARDMLLPGARAPLARGGHPEIDEGWALVDEHASGFLTDAPASSMPGRRRSGAFKARVPARPCALGEARGRGAAAGAAGAHVALWLVLGLAACVALQLAVELQTSNALSGYGITFAPRGRLLRSLNKHPWALAALPPALAAALLPGLLRGRALHFADCGAEARYADWLNAGGAARDVLVHAAWLALGTSAFVHARSGGAAAELGELAGWLPPCLLGGGGAAAFGAAALAALVPLAALGPAAPAAAAAALRSGWYAAHRERVLVAARLLQALAALWLRARGGAAPAAPAPAAAAAAAGPGLAGAWAPALSTQVAVALLARVRLSAFLPAQLLHVLAVAATWPAGGGGAAAGAGGLQALLYYSRLIGLGWCAPALLVLAVESVSRRAFALSGYGAAPAPRPGAKGGGAAAKGAAAW
ncbi:MAG: hypothetical protein J3K34DRAFT_389750 [Monoraphidium minutum]|nr:MAG: hypothetical protein J3K34DRAFT_389750 [Monoraphidium minutum]